MALHHILHFLCLIGTLSNFIEGRALGRLPEAEAPKPAPNAAPGYTIVAPKSPPKSYDPPKSTTPSPMKSPPPTTGMHPTGCPANLTGLVKADFSKCSLDRKGALKDVRACCSQGLLGVNRVLMRGKSTNFKAIISNSTVNELCYKELTRVIKAAGVGLPKGKSDWGGVCGWWLPKEVPQPKCTLDTKYRINSKSYTVNLFSVCNNANACDPQKSQLCTSAIKKQTDLFGGSKNCGNLVVLRLLQEYYPTTYKVVFKEFCPAMPPTFPPLEPPVPGKTPNITKDPPVSPNPNAPKSAPSPKPDDGPRQPPPNIYQSPAPAPVNNPGNITPTRNETSPPRNDTNSSVPPVLPPALPPTLPPVSPPPVVSNNTANATAPTAGTLSSDPPPAATPTTKKSSAPHRSTTSAATLGITLLSMLAALF